MSRAEKFWNVPNTLTLGRLALGLVVFGLIAAGHYLPALLVFALAAGTDALDGYLARLLNQSTAIGRQLDPLVDKLLVSGGFIYLLKIPGTGLAPWMVASIVARELIVQALRSLIEGRGVAFGARLAGKLKTLLQCLSIAAILAVLWLEPSRPWRVGRDALTWSAVVLTIYSGLGYVALAWPSLRGDEAEKTPT